MLSADSLVSATPDSAPAGAALHERDKVRGLFTAAQGGSASQLTEAAQHFQGQDLNRVRDGRGRTALHFAAQSGRADACKYLLDFFQVDPNSRAEDGDTPLGLAAAAGHLDVCRLLSEQGAQVHAQGRAHPEPLHRAAASGNLEVVHWLLQHGAPVDSSSPAGTPLLWAAGSGQDSAVSQLLAAGADVNATTADGISAVIMASAAGSSSTVAELIKGGADVNVNAAGVTALHTAAECGSMDTVKALLQAGADANAIDLHGHTALDAAVQENDRDMIQLLLPVTNADVNDWTVDGVLSHKQAAPVTVNQHGSQSLYQADQIPAAAEPDEAAAAYHKRLGDEAFVRKNFSEAAASYSQSLQHSTASHLVWANRSAAHLHLGQHETALKDAQIALSICPAFAKAHYREGSALAAMHRWEDAANAFFSGYQVEPTNKILAEAFQFAVKQGRAEQQQTGLLADQC